MSFSFKLQNGTFFIAANGRLATVENTEKLEQDCLKIIITSCGSNPFCPPYGSLLNSAVIGGILDPQFTADAASNQIKNSLENLQKFQKDQITSNQILSAAEQLAGVKNIKVERNTTDPRFYSIVVDIFSRSLDLTNISFNLQL